MTRDDLDDLRETLGTGGAIAYCATFTVLFLVAGVVAIAVVAASWPASGVVVGVVALIVLTWARILRDTA